MLIFTCESFSFIKTILILMPNQGTWPFKEYVSYNENSSITLVLKIPEKSMSSWIPTEKDFSLQRYLLKTKKRGVNVVA